MPTRLHACGACETPEFLGFEAAADGAIVAVSNFGLLTQRDGNWLLTCEEVIGGLLLSTDSDATGHFVSTSGGLFRSGEDTCDWQLAQDGSSSDWFADFAIATPSHSAGSARFAVSTDAVAGEVRVERARADGLFEVVRTLGLERGYQLLSAAGDPTAVFVCGYSFGPATWHIAFSLDGGDTWTEHSEPAADANELFVPLGLDPQYPTRLLLTLETRADRPDELWSFDAETASLTRLFVLGELESAHGIAWRDTEVIVSAKARGATTGVLYTASRSDLEFERLGYATPPLDCLHAQGESLFGCVNDFSLDSEQLLTRSLDRGQTWEPILRLEDLLQIDSCAGCDVTEAWLREGYGLPPSSGGQSVEASDAGVRDAGARREETAVGTVRNEGSTSANDGGCSVLKPVGNQRPWSINLLVIILGLLVSRHQARGLSAKPTSCV